MRKRVSLLGLLVLVCGMIIYNIYTSKKVEIKTSLNPKSNQLYKSTHNYIENRKNSLKVHQLGQLKAYKERLSRQEDEIILSLEEKIKNIKKDPGQVHHSTKELYASVDVLRPIFEGRIDSIASLEKRVNFFSKCSLSEKLLLSMRALCLNYAFKLSLKQGRALRIEKYPTNVIDLANKVNFL